MRTISPERVGHFEAEAKGVGGQKASIGAALIEKAGPKCTKRYHSQKSFSPIMATADDSRPLENYD
jgi:hypothetical protein